jgi:ABC-2 type transport system permease protein
MSVTSPAPAASPAESADSATTATTATVTAAPPPATVTAPPAAPAGRVGTARPPFSPDELSASEGPVALVALLLRRMVTLSIVELQKLRHDRVELYTRAVQPALWLLIFGVTFNRIHAIPTGHVRYLDYLAPGIVAQSALFISIFYGIQIIWDRDAGVLAKLLVTPTPRAALVAGKAFASGVRALVQVIVVLILSAILGVGLTDNPLKLIGAAAAVVLGAGFFTCLSIVIAGLVLSRDRLMGIGQAIMMPLFFASNALYPVALMPRWVRDLSHVNPLSYQVDALRGLLIGVPAHLGVDFGVLAGVAVVTIGLASVLLGRLAR